MTVTGLDTVDWHQLGLIGVVAVCIFVILALVVPADAGRSKKGDGDWPKFPPF